MMALSKIKVIIKKYPFGDLSLFTVTEKSDSQLSERAI